MPAIEYDGLAPAEVRALRSALARDRALAAELELIVPALDRAARLPFMRALARGCSAGARPAAAVLAALVVASRRTR